MQNIETQAKEKNCSLFQVMKQSDNKDIIIFIKLVEELTDNFKIQKPKDFIKLLLEKINYYDYISKLPRYKIKK